MFNRQLFILAHEMGDLSFYLTYQHLIKNQWKSCADLRVEQEKLLRHMIQYCNDNVPFYHTLFKNLGIKADTIKTVEDLQKLPVLTKETIKENWEAFKPVPLSGIKYHSATTGGSTGVPLTYRVSKFDRFLSGALLYRGWGYCGYELGDKMVILGGSSLDVGSKTKMITFIHETARNFKKLSSLDLGEKEMRNYAEVLNAFQPKFIRGYASSIYFYAQWLEKNSVVVPSPHAVFTTADKLYPHMRETIGRVFECEVFDGYGLNDGGISAYECPEHCGLHIDTERSVMEVVDPKGHQIENGEGRILATSLHNYAMPFIRYDTGDLGSITDRQCSCGRQSPLIENIIGREKEFLIAPNGQRVYGADLIFLIFVESKMPEIGNKIKEFQIIQSEPRIITILLVCDEVLPDFALDNMRAALQKRYNGWEIEFQFVDAIDRTRAGKYKFIINEIGK